MNFFKTLKFHQIVFVLVFNRHTKVLLPLVNFPFFSSFFFSILSCIQRGDHPQEDAAKFGYNIDVI